MEKLTKEIKYIGFYDTEGQNSKRICEIASKNKMDYICSSINKAGYNVNIISPSWISDSSIKMKEKKNIKRINSNTIVTFCPSWSTDSKLTRNIKIIYTLFWLFLYLVFNTKKGEKILAYHVQWISWPIRAAKFIKRFLLILEVEEIYQDVMKVKPLLNKWENKLLKSADAYLLSSDILEEKLNAKKPKIIIYGVYDTKEQLAYPIDDGRIHLVYAGIIDSHKKGAFNALEATKYLPQKYHLHIIGFGEVEKLCRLIGEYNRIYSCKTSYDGIKEGDEYIKYCQSCHIGLSTQSMEGRYLESSFPSKILSYLSMGLRVISCKILCVEKSAIGGIVSYYQQDTPEEIAKAIMNVDLSQQNSNIQIIKKLDVEFVALIKQMLGK